MLLQGMRKEHLQRVRESGVNMNEVIRIHGHRVIRICDDLFEVTINGIKERGSISKIEELLNRTTFVHLTKIDVKKYFVMQEVDKTLWMPKAYNKYSVAAIMKNVLGRYKVKIAETGEEDYVGFRCDLYEITPENEKVVAELEELQSKVRVRLEELYEINRVVNKLRKKLSKEFMEGAR